MREFALPAHRAADDPGPIAPRRKECPAWINALVDNQLARSCHTSCPLVGLPVATNFPTIVRKFVAAAGSVRFGRAGRGEPGGRQCQPTIVRCVATGPIHRRFILKRKMGTTTGGEAGDGRRQISLIELIWNTLCRQVHSPKRANTLTAIFHPILSVKSVEISTISGNCRLTDRFHFPF